MERFKSRSLLIYEVGYNKIEEVRSQVMTNVERFKLV